MFANTSSGSTGNGGSLRIATGQLIVRDKAQVNVSSRGTGAAGNLEVAADSIRLDNRASLIAETQAGAQGNITLHSRDLVLRRNSNITTNAGGTATGGNITLDTGVLAAIENSDITANATSNFGGRVIVNAQGIFGTQFREVLTPESDITATSALGPQFRGIVQINTPDVDPSLGLVTLPAEVFDASNQIATGCATGGESVASNQFIITGRGGLPPVPIDPLTGEAVLTTWASLDSDVENRSSAAPSTPTKVSAPTQIVAATGWVINNKGEVLLTATPPTVTPDIPWINRSSCQTPQNSSPTNLVVK